MALVTDASAVGGQPPAPPNPSISAAADRARALLHEEIERLRMGVEEMLAEQAEIDPLLRRELDDMREETRLYVRKRMKKSERKLERGLRKVEERTGELEERVEQVEAERAASEVRIYGETERLLDGLLQEIRTIADLFERSGRGGGSPARPQKAPHSGTLRDIV